jgi:hypothetical protein
MGIKFRLKKPIYEWRSLDFKSGNDLFLCDAARTWLEEHQIKYETDTRVELAEDNYRYLVFYIYIPNHNSAMFFKLTWFMNIESSTQITYS